MTTFPAAKQLIANLFFCLGAMTLASCSTVRDATDWMPGVDSNEEVKAKEEAEAAEASRKAREEYLEKSVYQTTLQPAQKDAEINVFISRKYSEDPQIDREDIGIEVNAGVVTLTGSVNTDEAAVQAISIARGTSGVKRVISRLVVIKVRDN